MMITRTTRLIIITSSSTLSSFHKPRGALLFHVKLRSSTSSLCDRLKYSMNTNLRQHSYYTELHANLTLYKISIILCFSRLLPQLCKMNIPNLTAGCILHTYSTYESSVCTSSIIRSQIQRLRITTSREQRKVSRNLFILEVAFYAMLTDSIARKQLM